MKLLFQLPILLAFSALGSCEKPTDNARSSDMPVPASRNDIPGNIPVCIQDEIRKIQAEPVANPPASVWQYQFEGQFVYYFPPKCCDIPGHIVDANCNYICSPDGGITGKGDGKCPEFFERRTGEKLIWQDERQ